MIKESAPELPLAAEKPSHPPHNNKRIRNRALTFILLVLFVTILHYHLPELARRLYSSGATSSYSQSSDGLEVCRQMPPWTPPSDLRVTKPSPAALAKLLSGAVQVDTTVPDEWGILSANSTGEIKKFYDDALLPLEKYLEESFPLVHQRLQKEVVDSHGLLYTWQGSDAGLKPLVLMAHQDVVPVEPSTVDDWTHPPFSGFVDEERGLVWGRGSVDDKTGIIGVMDALESLLSTEGFAPRRTIIASFGFDEESAGSGADALGAFLVERYGEDGAEMIVDEGGGVLGPDSPWGTAFAAPDTAEKGYMDVRVVVNTPGGHSSAPPKRTGVGYLSRLVAHIEDNPPEADLQTLDHPALAAFLCLRNAPGFQKRKGLKKALDRLAAAASSASSKKRDLSKAYKELLAALSDDERNPFKTIQAIDLIRGGVKINALPEQSVATINYRIDAYTPSKKLQASLSDLVAPKARELGLEFAGWREPGIRAHRRIRKARPVGRAPSISS